MENYKLSAMSRKPTGLVFTVSRPLRFQLGASPWILHRNRVCVYAEHLYTHTHTSPAPTGCVFMRIISTHTHTHHQLQQGVCLCGSSLHTHITSSNRMCVYADQHAHGCEGDIPLSVFVSVCKYMYICISRWMKYSWISVQSVSEMEVQYGALDILREGGHLYLKARTTGQK